MGGPKAGLDVSGKGATVQLFNKPMMKPAADQLNPGHTYTPHKFMSLNVYVVLSKFDASLTNNSLSTGFPNTLFNIFAVYFSTAIYNVPNCRS
jgi:hypothetical protein